MEAKILDKLDFVDAIADWLLDLSESGASSKDYEAALKWAHLAASTLSRANRKLTNSRLERILLHIARTLPDEKTGAYHKVTYPNRVCLHVLSEALAAGGHTAMATRWMAGDESGGNHSVALLREVTPVPATLQKAVSDRGGKIFVAAPHSTTLERVLWLRRLVYEHASYVILHIDATDVISCGAFGIPGGPPVMLTNHSAHTFWTGASIIDLLLNCRGSALEGYWAVNYRGISRYATLPIPLSDLHPPNAGESRGKERLNTARVKLGIDDPAAIVFLTVGASFKYLPAGQMDFVQTCEKLLAEVHTGIVLVAGFLGDERWQAAAQRTGGRIRTLGRLSQDELELVRDATDIYMEGFPFGTTTSLLESGLRGIPVVLAPADCPPPYGSDGIALDGVVERPATVQAYIDVLVRLARDSAERKRCGVVIRHSIQEHHTGEGWRRYLETVIQQLPVEHATYSPSSYIETPKAIHEYWSRFLVQWSWGYEESLESGLLEAYAHGLKPVLSSKVQIAARKATVLRKGCSIPLPLLVFVCNHVFIWLPPATSRLLLAAIFSVFRGSLVTRAHNLVMRWLGFVKPARGAYEEYRQASSTRAEKGRTLKNITS